MKYRSLIVDDEKAVHTVIKKLCPWRALGIEEPRSARNGEEAISLMRELHPHIVFVDMNMPVMDGSTFLAKASAEFPESKLIIVSGYDDFRYAKIALQAKALDYLLKPVAADELNKVVNHAVTLLNAETGRRAEDAEAYSGTPSYTAETVPDAIKDYLDRHYAEDISLESLGAQFCFTKEYLSRLFKKKFNCGIYEYVQDIRMARAKELLKDPSLQIQAIAEQLGYNDSNYFSKAFRSFTGISPSEYRDS
jgi:YesN/AraC family two-component response regulator